LGETLSTATETDNIISKTSQYGFNQWLERMF